MILISVIRVHCSSWLANFTINSYIWNTEMMNPSIVLLCIVSCLSPYCAMFVSFITWMSCEIWVYFQRRTQFIYLCCFMPEVAHHVQILRNLVAYMWLSGVVVRAFASRSEDPWFDFPLGRNFFRTDRYRGSAQPQRNGYLVMTSLPQIM